MAVTLRSYYLGSTIRAMPPAPKPCGMVSAAPEARQVPHVRTLPDHILAGSVPAAVRLSRAAELPAALQRGADAADPGRSHRGRSPPIRAGAVGPDPALGQGSAKVHVADQRAGRIGERQASLPLSHAAAPLPGARRRFLRVEGRGRTQAPLLRAAEGWRADRLRRIVGDLDRAERRGTG